MKHFRLMQKGVDVKAFLEELEAMDSSWSAFRAQSIPCQRETVSIKLREAIPMLHVRDIDNPFTRKTEMYERFPHLTTFLEGYADSIRGELARVIVVKLKERGKVYPHYDKGLYYSLRDRYHLVLKSEGSEMISGKETQIFQRGELWWFDNKAEHVALNKNVTPRVHVIFDVLPKSPWGRLKNYFKRHRADAFGYVRIPQERFIDKS